MCVSFVEDVFYVVWQSKKITIPFREEITNGNQPFVISCTRRCFTVVQKLGQQSVKSRSGTSTYFINDDTDMKKIKN